MGGVIYADVLLTLWAGDKGSSFWLFSSSVVRQRASSSPTTGPVGMPGRG